MKPVVRLYLYFATENDRAVILRQGPTRQFRMILWHRMSDTFEDGQWVKQRVYPECCDLSPDGRHFLYAMLDGKWQAPGEGVYTAISQPPYFTALSLFPEGSTWGLGGRFLDNVNFVATGDEDVVGRARGLIRVYRRTPTKDCPTGLFTKDGRPARIGKAKAAKIMPEKRPQSWTTGLDSYDTLGGKLYRRRGQELELIRDFEDMAFERIRAPYDWRGGEDSESSNPSTWHPLDGERS